MLLPSANDAANALAEHISGSISGFADLMNEKAIEIGCSNSHFTNPSGIHDENLYSTAHDLSLIARYAMNIKTFRNIVSTHSYTLPSTEAYPKFDRTLTISNSLINANHKSYYYEYATGVKTGYTGAAKDCLIASAKKDDVEFIIVVLGSGHTDNGQKAKYLDCKTLFNFAFDNYTAYYKNLQEEKERNSKIVPVTVSLTEDSEANNNNVNNFLRDLSKIIAVITIILVLRFLFRKRTRRKKKNHYKRGGKKKSKHSR